MSRATYGAARNRKKHRVKKLARGYRGARRKHWRLIKEAVVRSGVAAFRDRRRRKRDFRRLWIIRITAACQARGIAYSRFIYGLEGANIELNRKVLSEMAISAPADFDAIVEIAKQHVQAAAAAA